MKNLLEIKNFNMRFKGLTEADFQISDVEINIPEGKTIAIVGESGSGKTLTALSILGLNPNSSIIQNNRQIIFDKKDFHIHVPEGATPKDGPSAGVGMVTSIISAITEIPVDRNVAMTGEITLRGLVLPIGGLKEKLLAAHRAGIKKVLIPILQS